MNRLLLLVLLGLSACAASPRAEAGPGPSTVRLRFDWAPGSGATVRAHRTAVDVSPRGHFVDEADVRLRFRVEGVGDGVVVRWEEAEVESLPGRWIPRTVEMVAVEVGQADFQVGPHGTFVQVRAPSETQARVAAWAARTLPREPRPPGAHARLIELFTEDAIAKRTALFWNHLVGVWNGGTMEIGEVYSARDEVRVPGLGGIPVEMEVRVSAREWVPCKKGERGASCIRLVLTAMPAEEQRPLLLEFTSNFFAADPEKELQILHEVEVVTDPRDLRPRLLHARELVDIPLAQGEHIRIEDERRLEFAWASPPAFEPGKNRR